MDITMIVEQICGLFLLVTGLAVLLRRKEIPQLIEDYRRSSGLLMMGGMFSLLFGLGIVLTHNIWAWEPGVIVTLLGWLSVTKGVALMIWPKAWMALIPSGESRLARVLGVEGVIMELLAIAVLWGAISAS